MWSFLASMSNTRRPLKITTFNVNGIRSIRDYYAQSKLNGCLNFSQFLDTFESDILCFQEHKTNEAVKLSQDLSCPPRYQAFYVFPKQPRKIGYSGVVTFVKESSPWRPIAWFDGFSGLNDGKLTDSPLLRQHFEIDELRELDSEARCIITDHLHFYLINCYFPNDSGEHRNEFRHRFYFAIQLRCLDLVKTHGKAVLLVGDINISYHPLDHCEYAPAFKRIFPSGFDIADFLKGNQPSSQELLNEFYANPMRKWLAEWLYLKSNSSAGIVADENTAWRDCFRAVKPFSEFHDQYTCWNTQISARGSNYGTRIDAIFTCGPLFADDSLVRLVDSNIMPQVMGSDHCPVFAEFAFDEAFLQVNDETLQSLQLKRGNIARSFGRMDEFFKKRTAEGVIETEPIVEPVKAIEEQPKKTKPGPSTILDYFSAKKTTKTQVTTTSETSKTVVTTEAIEANNSDHIVVSESIAETKEAWSSVFTKRVAPLCHHGRESVLNRVKKAGPNRGRSFYACARPVGPPGDPNSRCDFFQWLNPERK